MVQLSLTLKQAILFILISSLQIQKPFLLYYTTPKRRGNLYICMVNVQTLKYRLKFSIHYKGGKLICFSLFSNFFIVCPRTQLSRLIISPRHHKTFPNVWDTLYVYNCKSRRTKLELMCVINLCHDGWIDG